MTGRLYTGYEERRGSPSGTAANRYTRLDVRPLAELVAKLILAEREDRRLDWRSGEVRINIHEVIPATTRQTTTARRKRFRAAVRRILAPHGYMISKEYICTKKKNVDKHDASQQEALFFFFFV